MKLRRLILAFVTLLVPVVMLAGKRPKVDLLKYYDPVLGIDTAVADVYLEVRHLYTDSLVIGYAPYDQHRQVDKRNLTWVPQEQIGYFVYDRYLYAPLTVQAGQEPVTYFMRHYRDRKSQVKIYTMGKRRQRQYYAFYPDSTVQEINNMVEFRDQERLERTGNHNFIRGFHWGVLAGVMGHGQLQIGSGIELDGDFPQSDAQQAVTAGMWMDWPFFRNGTSLHAKVLYQGFSARTQRGGVICAYNRQGLDLPLTLRYSCLHVPGRVIPFVEGGLSCRLAWQNRLECMWNHYEQRPDGHGYPTGQVATAEQNPTGVDFAPVVGGGLRYRINDTRHAMLTLNYNFKSVLAQYDLPAISQLFIEQASASSWTLTLAIGLR